jgi:hypothetical protein
MQPLKPVWAGIFCIALFAAVGSGCANRKDVQWTPARASTGPTASGPATVVVAPPLETETPKTAPGLPAVPTKPAETG